jgi:hypothetical protein
VDHDTQRPNQPESDEPRRNHMPNQLIEQRQQKIDGNMSVKFALAGVSGSKYKGQLAEFRCRRN